jgi:hypothetical protein
VNHVYIGIDVGKRFCWVCVLDEDGDCVYFDVLPTLCKKSWREMLELFSGCSIHAVFEVGGHYDWMYDMLMEHCAEVIVYAPLEKARKKTDRLDASKLALRLSRGDLESIFVPPAWMRKDRRLVARLHVLSSNSARIKINLRDMLHSAQLCCSHTDLGGARARSWISTFALPKL